MRSGALSAASCQLHMRASKSGLLRQLSTIFCYRQVALHRSWKSRSTRRVVQKDLSKAEGPRQQGGPETPSVGTEEGALVELG
eukprot:1073499-Pelagomonas_calceolata.AAC.6